MLQAVASTPPLLKTLAVAGALAVAAFMAHESKPAEGTVQRLVLHAPVAPNALYLTAWSDGDVYVTLHGDAPRAMTFQTRAYINDGCEWLATERLVPDGASRYAYAYSEQILSCEPGATPARKTPRTGYVDAISVR
jgi:hypothetical protein